MIKLIYGGVCLEDAIDGFMTVNVDGRKFHDINSGSRTLTVEYAIKGDDRTYINDAYRRLNLIFDQNKDVDIIFTDEPEFYWTGRISKMSISVEGYNGDSGVIEFELADQYKYSIEEKEYEAALNDDGEMVCSFFNDGSVSVPIDYEIVHNHENGYIGITSANGGMMEYGYIEEEDVISMPTNEVVGKFEGYAALNSNFAKGQGIFRASNRSDFSQNGAWTEKVSDGYSWLMPNNWGTGSWYRGVGGKWTLPNGSDGKKPLNWEVSAQMWFQLGANGQTGAFQLALADESDNFFCKIFARNITTSNITTRVYMSVVEDGAEKIKQQFDYTANASGATNLNSKPIQIKKMDDMITFVFNGISYKFIVDSIKNVRVGSVSLFMGNYGTMTTNPYRLRCRNITFTRINSDSTKDVPNRYADGSVVKIDGSAGKFYVDGVPQHQDEVRGTEYFFADPGQNIVQFSYSGFSSPAPTCKLRFREAWS